MFETKVIKSDITHIFYLIHFSVNFFKIIDCKGCCLLTYLLHGQSPS